MNNKFVLSENFCFVDYDFKNFGIRPFSVLRIFSKLAVQHAELLDIGFEKMLSKNLLWVTMRIKFQIVRMPKPNELLRITTYPSGKNMLEYDRDFVIQDENDKLVIKGTSKWCLISSDTRRIAKLADIEAPELSNFSPLFDGKFLKTETFEPDSLPKYSYNICENDIDDNNHTNNTIYAKVLETALESETREIDFFQINFLRETRVGDRLDIYHKTTEKADLYLGKINGEELSFSAEIRFQEN